MNESWFGIVDPDDRRWSWFSADQELTGFGTVWGVLVYDGDIVVVTDPPVAFASGTKEVAAGFTGARDWRPVPDQAARTLTAALAWVHEVVHPTPIDPEPDRLLTKGEVTDDPPLSTKASSACYLADRRRAAFRAELEPGGAARFDFPPGEWVRECSRLLIEPAERRYVSLGGTTHGSVSPRTSIAANAMYQTGLASWPDSLPAQMTPGSTAWQEHLRALDDGEHGRAHLTAGIALPTGSLRNRYWGEVTVQAGTESASDRPSLTLEVSEGFLSLTGDAVLLDLVQFALRRWPIARARVTFQRSTTAGPWIAVVPFDSVSAAARAELAASQVFDFVTSVPGREGEMLWMQTTPDPRALDDARNSAALDLIRSVGIEPDSGFFTG